MDAIQAVARKHDLAVIEDACQAWLGEYHGRKCGALGDLGCFSFQNSKHIPAGEGGAVTGDREELLDRCQAYHNCGRGHGTFQGRGCFSRGTNFRLTHYQASLLRQQIEKLVADTARRRANAEILTAGLREIPGVHPARLPEDSQAAWHLYPFRYDPAAFHGLPRERFLQALRAEGIPAGGGYHEQYFDGLLDEAIASRGFRRLFSAERLRAYRESFQELRGNRQVCETTVAFSQNLLLAERRDLERIPEAIHRIQQHSAALAT
jgi:dTDP-4-amino-4,6-dideoxygalactose transaminase